MLTWHYFLWLCGHRRSLVSSKITIQPGNAAIPEVNYIHGLLEDMILMFVLKQFNLLAQTSQRIE